MAADAKNIAIIGPAWPLRGGGMSTFNERMARAFQQEGHRVHIYTFSLQYPSFLFPGTTQYSEEPAPANLSIDVCINSVNPLNWITTGNRIAKAGHDVVIVRYWLPFMGPALGTILRRVKKGSDARIICIADNVLPHEKRPGDAQFTKYFIKPVDAFVVMSRKVQEDLRKFSTDKKTVLTDHPLYDNFGDKQDRETAREKLNIDTNAFTALFFGFIRKYKGLDLLLRAIPEVVKAIPDFKLIIAGEFYGDAEEYEKLMDELNLRNYLELHTRFIRDQEVKAFFSAADVVVQPYRSATQSGVTPLAYHFEVPMIVSNVGGLPDMIEDGVSGLVTEPDPASIAQTLIEFHKKGTSFFMPGLLERKKMYSWETFTQKILELAGA